MCYSTLFVHETKSWSRSRSDGAGPLQDLREMSQDYRLRRREVDLKDALEAVSLGRPVIASGWLTEHERDSFRKFFGDDRNRTGILTRTEIDRSNSRSSQ